MRNIGCWASAAVGPIDGKVRWNIQVEHDGQYEISGHLHAMEATQLNFRINGGDVLPFSCTKNDGYEIQPLGNLSLSKGTYEIELTRTAITATWSYVNLLSIFLTPNASTKIEQADELKEISVYTHSNELYVEGLEAGSSISLYSVLGEKICTQHAGNSVVRIDLHNHAVVILHVECADGRGGMVRKIVKN